MCTRRWRVKNSLETWTNSVRVRLTNGQRHRNLDRLTIDRSGSFENDSLQLTGLDPALLGDQRAPSSRSNRRNRHEVKLDYRDPLSCWQRLFKRATTLNDTIRRYSWTTKSTDEFCMIARVRELRSLSLVFSDPRLNDEGE